MTCLEGLGPIYINISFSVISWKSNWFFDSVLVIISAILLLKANYYS